MIAAGGVLDAAGLRLRGAHDAAEELAELLGPGGGVELEVDDHPVWVLVAADDPVGPHAAVLRAWSNLSKSPFQVS